jgi:hypothetical protein
VDRDQAARVLQARMMLGIQPLGPWWLLVRVPLLVFGVATQLSEPGFYDPVVFAVGFFGLSVGIAADILWGWLTWRAQRVLRETLPKSPAPDVPAGIAEQALPDGRAETAR